MKKKIEQLKVKALTYEGAILNAIKGAYIHNQKVVKIGLPKRVQKEIVIQMIKSTDKELPSTIPDLQTIYGIPVEEAETMQITTEFSRLVNLNL